MNSGLWWIFDGITIILAVCVIISNAKRGVTKVLVLAIGYIIATLLASFLSSAAAPSLYRSVARQSNLTALQSVNSHVDLTAAFVNSFEEHKYGFEVNTNDVVSILANDNERFEDDLYDYVNERSGSIVCAKSVFTQALRETFVKAYEKEMGERMPKYVRQHFIQQSLNNPSVMRQIVKQRYAVKCSEKQRAELLEDLFSKEPSTEVLQIFIYLILFSVLMVIAAIISAMLQNRIFFNFRRSSEVMLGGVLGVLEAGAMVILLTLIVRLIVMLSGNELGIINDATIMDSKVFSFFYEHVKSLI